MKIMVHHAVLGAGMATEPQPMVEREGFKGLWRRRWPGGNGVQATTVPGMTGRFTTHQGRARSTLRWDSGLQGDEPKLARGYAIKFWVEADAFDDAHEASYWVEAMHYPDNDERQTHRELHGGDGRCCFSRVHAVLWPDKATADRWRHKVPFVDPVTLDPNLRECPPPTVLDDDPCPACDGTGHRNPDDPTRRLEAELRAAHARIASLQAALREVVMLPPEVREEVTVVVRETRTVTTERAVRVLGALPASARSALLAMPLDPALPVSAGAVQVMLPAPEDDDGGP